MSNIKKFDLCKNRIIIHVEYQSISLADADEVEDFSSSSKRKWKKKNIPRNQARHDTMDLIYKKGKPEICIYKDCSTPNTAGVNMLPVQESLSGFIS